MLLSDHKFKVADYGSAQCSDQFLVWSELHAKYEQEPEIIQKHVGKAFEYYEKNTTMMYRPPEMIDRYSKQDVGLPADIWMLGCILFTLCFAKQPFQDAQSLAILNGKYYMPEENDSRVSVHMRKLIQVMLQTQPERRPTIQQVLQILDNLKQNYKRERQKEIEQTLASA